MSDAHNNTKEYFDFAADLMDELHDVAALINSANTDGLDDLELDLDDAGLNAKRLLGMAAKKLNDAVMALDQSSFAYTSRMATGIAEAVA
ncbi:hypothetical protein [Propionivibrio limicola]|uniref:hypothetical protein n=1 Tax=Propionivibrio limicola TaxID=167645 RepID=UPI00129119E1|nr:hypothetical protein [Propionivibrio limicola]